MTKKPSIGCALASMKAKQSLGMTMAANNALGVFSENQTAFYRKMSAIESLGIGSVLESFKASQSAMGLSVEDFDEISEESVVEACEGLSECSKEASFKEFFEALPNPIKFIIGLFLLQLFLPVIQNVIANLVTPYVQSYIESKAGFSQKVSMNYLKRIPEKAQVIDVTGLRFISGDNVRLRRSSSTSSEILDEMVLGQVVTILSKKRNWIEVMYEYDDGEVLTGWVFTRYTKRFHR